MEFRFEAIEYDRTLPSLPKHSGVYKIFDTRNKLIVLDKTSNLSQRLERYYGDRSETVRDLDLREITSRIEYIRTDSSFETLYILYLERKKYFPKAYRKMRTFRLFNLMKINRKQRFPRLYASRQVKMGVDYFGPFVSRSQFARLKTTLERTFKLRPCLYNIRGNDPHPDCLYFQMHTCSRPCNADVNRQAYLDDVQQAISFIQGDDKQLEETLYKRMNDLAGDTKFEEAEVIRRKLEKVRHGREEFKDTFFSVWDFDFLVVLPSQSVSRCKVGFVRQGKIIGFEEYEVDDLNQTVEQDIHRFFDAPAERDTSDSRYDDFCLVSNFIIDPVRTVDLLPVQDVEQLAGKVVQRIEQRKRRIVNKSV